MGRRPGRPLACGCSRSTEALNLSWLAPDLAVGGRIASDRVADLAGDLGIGALIDLRDEDRDDVHHLARHGIDFLHLPTADHGALAPEALETGVAFAVRTAEAGRKLLVHCEHGIGRSATLALAILVDRGFEPLAALRHAKAVRPVVSPSPAQYGCWTAWLRSRPVPVAIPDFDAFKRIAYRHLREA